MKKTMVKKIVSTLGFAVMALPMVVSAQSYKSASFGFTGSELASQVEVSQAAVLYCKADVLVSGEAEAVKCFDKTANAALEADTERSVKKLAFNVAEVDGKAVPVRMNFRVVYSVTENGADAVLIPNLGTMQDRYGRDYVAPQERLDVSDWYARYNKNSWVNGDEFIDEGPMSRIAATVRADGKPTLVRTLDAERAYKRDASIVKSALKASRFIPGFVDEKAVPMGYIAVVNYGEQGNKAVSSRQMLNKKC